MCDQDAEDELAQLPRDPLLLEGLRDDRGARNGDDGAREQALEARPPEEAADRESQPDHEAGLEQGGEPGRRPDFREPAETELEPERKHQEDDAQLRERLHDDRVGHEGDRHVGPDDQPGDDVAQHDRLTQALEHHRRHRSHAEDDREGLQELVGVVHAR